MLCTLHVNGPCDQEAVEILRINPDSPHPEDHPRCAQHPAKGFAQMLLKVHPGTPYAILPAPPTIGDEWLEQNAIRRRLRVFELTEDGKARCFNIQREGGEKREVRISYARLRRNFRRVKAGQGAPC
ncbi:MAG TPA: hypothetical protein VH208_01935 [Myxococcaceae bacterium]|jgi:hypothetical protein|nr:hypothetical protein [Myxococcaceae bacterium]